MTYARFLLAFVVAPALLIALARRRHYRRADVWALVPTAVIVFAASFPWDSYAVRHGYWSFDPARISGLHLGVLPAEECAFFVLETLLVAAVVLPILRAGRQHAS